MGKFIGKIYTEICTEIPQHGINFPNCKKLEEIERKEENKRKCKLAHEQRTQAEAERQAAQAERKCQSEEAEKKKDEERKEAAKKREDELIQKRWQNEIKKLQNTASLSQRENDWA